MHDCLLEPACILETQYTVFVTGLLSQLGSVASCLLNAKGKSHVKVMS